MQITRVNKLRRLRWLTHATGTAFVALSAVAGYFTIYSPIANRKADDGRRLEQLNELLAEGPGIESKHAQLVETLHDLRSRAEEVRRRIPDKPDEAGFLTEIIGIAESNSLKILDYDRGSVKTQVTHSELEVSLKCAGSFASICGFVDQLEKLGRVSSVRRMTCGSKRDEDGYPFDLTIVIYFGMRVPEETANG